jgi:pyrroloquinoline quinone biosynthesis protein B
LSLREREAFTLFATPDTHTVLVDNPVFSVLTTDLVVRQPVLLGESFKLPGDLQAEVFAAPGKVPLYLEGHSPETASEPAGNVGIKISVGSARMIYIPGAAAVTAAMIDHCADADAVFFDGTLFHDDEMIRTGTGGAHAHCRQMWLARGTGAGSRSTHLCAYQQYQSDSR